VQVLTLVNFYPQIITIILITRKDSNLIKNTIVYTTRFELLWLERLRL